MSHLLMLLCYLPYLYILCTFFLKTGKTSIDLPYNIGLIFYLKVVPLYAIPLFFSLFKEEKDYQIIRYVSKKKIIHKHLLGIFMDAFLCSISFLMMNRIVFKHLRVYQSLLFTVLLICLLLMQSSLALLLHDPLLLIMTYVVSSPMMSDYMQYMKQPLLTDLFIPESLFTRYPHPLLLIPVCLCLLAINSYLIKRKEYL